MWAIEESRNNYTAIFLCVRYLGFFVSVHRFFRYSGRPAYWWESATSHRSPQFRYLCYFHPNDIFVVADALLPCFCSRVLVARMTWRKPKRSALFSLLICSGFVGFICLLLYTLIKASSWERVGSVDLGTIPVCNKQGNGWNTV